MRLLERILSCDMDGIEGEATLHADGPFVRDGRVSAVVALELMAQAAAAWVGWKGRHRGEPPRPGYLVNVRELVLHTDGFSAGTTLAVDVRTGHGDADQRRFDGTVRAADAPSPAARASFTVYRGPAVGGAHRVP
jgi:predicted hotdog family 3-hydroxylacyl-ACP dehydratase